MNPIVLSASQREELESLVRRGRQAAALVRRARVVLLTDEGVSAVEIAERLDLSPESVSRIRKRFLDGGVEALHDRPKAGRRDHALTSETIAYIVQLAQSPPPRGRSRWTTRLLASYFGITSGAVSDVLRKHGSRPHLVTTHEVGRDAQFARGVKDIVGLYLSPPEHALVLRLDEETSTGALGRAGGAARPAHELLGALELCAALKLATGRLAQAPVKSPVRADVLPFLKKVDRAYSGEGLYVILDNSSSHGAPELRQWLGAHPSVRFHYAPTKAAWLSQVEGFFDIAARQSLPATTLASNNALREPLRAYLRAWKQNPTPFEWTKPARAISK